MDDLLIIFAKAPIAGLVKTRLFPHLSFDEAAEMQRAFLADTVDKALAIPGINACIAYTPEKAVEVFKDICGDRVASLMPQEGADLGERMDRAFSSAFEAGAKKTVIIGADIPTLPACYICAAFRMLGEFDLVLGPAKDGGFYLIALKCPAPGLLTNVAWSGPDVLATVTAKAEASGLRVSFLPPLRDVDTFEDLKGLIGQPLPPNTSRMLLAIEAKLGPQPDWVV